jgi:hypothetical protein
MMVYAMLSVDYVVNYSVFVLVFPSMKPLDSVYLESIWKGV